VVAHELVQPSPLKAIFCVCGPRGGAKGRSEIIPTRFETGRTHQTPKSFSPMFLAVQRSTKIQRDRAYVHPRDASDSAEVEQQTRDRALDARHWPNAGPARQASANRGNQWHDAPKPPRKCPWFRCGTTLPELLGVAEQPRVSPSARPGLTKQDMRERLPKPWARKARENR
jgi:hypothetical protein